MEKAMTDVLKYKRKTFLFVFLAIALVLATWYKLKIQGITLTEDISYEEILICENADENHVHSAECYEKVAVTSSDKQNEIDNTTEEQKLTTTDTTSNENSQEQKEDSQEILENNEEQAETQQNLEENQEDIPQDEEQTEIANDINNNGTMLAANALGQASTYALGDTSTDNSQVNVYMYIDNDWTSIGYVERGSYKSGRTTYYTVSSENIINLIKSELGITVASSELGTLYYSNGTSYSKTTLSNGIYTIGTTNTHRDIYITAGLTNNTRTRTQLTNGNKFKVYTITEVTAEDVEIENSPTYIYTTTGTATYQLRNRL